MHRLAGRDDADGDAEAVVGPLGGPTVGGVVAGALAECVGGGESSAEDAGAPVVPVASTIIRGGTLTPLGGVLVLGGGDVVPPAGGGG